MNARFPAAQTRILQYNYCEEPESEEEAYEGSQYYKLDDLYCLAPLCNGKPKYCRYCKRHGECWAPKLLCRESSSSGEGHRTLDFLTVCNAMYLEALPILYATTIFSFKQAQALATFINTLNPSHRPNIRSIHLEIIHDIMLPSPWTGNSFGLASSISMLTGLRTLHINIFQSSPCTWRKGTNRVKQFINLTPEMEAYMNAFRAGDLLWWEDELDLFHRPTLKRVTVIIGDTDPAPIDAYPSYTRLIESSMRDRGFWTMEEKATWARLLREKLLSKEICVSNTQFYSNQRQGLSKCAFTKCGLLD